LRGHKFDEQNVDWSWRSHPFRKENNINGIEADLNNDGLGLELHTLRNAAVNELQKAYIRKVIDVLNDLDNIIYEVGNEFIYSEENTDWQYWVINYIKEYEALKEKQHPAGMVCQMHFPWKRSIDGDIRNEVLFSSPGDWISPGGYGGRGYLDHDSIPVADGSKVLLFDTDHIWGIGGDRAWVWKSFTRGHNVLFMDPLPEITEQISTFHYRAEIRSALGHTLTFARKMDLANMIPNADGSFCSTTFCLVNNGKEYLIYQPKSETNIDIYLPVGKYSYEWFNPSTGKVSERGRYIVKLKGRHSFNSSFIGDAVLYITKNKLFY